MISREVKRDLWYSFREFVEYFQFHYPLLLPRQSY